MRNFTLSLFILVVTTSEASSIEISCEKIETIDDSKICFLDKRTAVRTTSVTFYPGVEDDVNAISFSFNQKVDFLPIQVEQKFPNLIQYRAASCAIRRVSKKNFEGLGKLEALRLSGNKIEKIAGNTFNGLSKLRLVYLENNKIKAMNGRLFDDLTSLEWVGLKSNICIDEDFEVQQDLKGVQRKVSEKCKFNEE